MVLGGTRVSGASNTLPWHFTLAHHGASGKIPQGPFVFWFPLAINRVFTGVWEAQVRTCLQIAREKKLSHWEKQEHERRNWIQN